MKSLEKRKKRSVGKISASEQKDSGSAASEQADSYFPEHPEQIQKIESKYNVELKEMEFLYKGLSGAGSFSFSGSECSLALRKILIDSVVKIENQQKSSEFRSEDWKQYQQLKIEVDNWISALNHWIRDYHGKKPSDTYIEKGRLNRIVRIIFRYVFLNTQEGFRHFFDKLIGVFDTNKQAISSFLINS